MAIKRTIYQCQICKYFEDTDFIICRLCGYDCLTKKKELYINNKKKENN